MSAFEVSLQSALEYMTAYASAALPTVGTVAVLWLGYKTLRKTLRSF